MFTRKQRAARRRAGFTLSEVIVTVGILAILMAVALPNVIALQKHLKMTELDSCAQQVLLAAQNNLTGAKSSGTLPRFLALGNAAEAVGADARYVTQASADAAKLLPMGAIDPAIVAQNYMLVFNPKTGTVLEAYYAEHAFTPENAFSLRGDDKKQARRDAALGYCSGSDTPGAAAVQLPAPTIAVTSGDELSVSVKIPLEWKIGTKLSVRVANAANAAYYKDFPLSPNAAGEATLVLDSLTDPARRFYKLFPETSGKQLKFPPGSDIAVTAHLEYVGGDKTCLPSQSVTETVNSLFAARTNTEVSIACGRHLQNLHPAFSGIKEYLPLAKQTDKIEWPKNLPFVPIENPLLDGYDGKELRISGVNIVPSAAGKPCGLFATTYKAALSNLRLVNTKIDEAAQSGASLGVLVGTAIDTTVSNCFVYVDDFENPAQYALRSSSQTTGGLIGAADGCTIKNSGAGLPSITAGGTVGGLIGSAENTTITNCYADIDQLQGRNSVAMLVGSSVGGAVTHSYAAGNISAAAQTVSGFIGGSSRVTDSYCAVSYFDASGDPLNLQNIAAFGSGSMYANCQFLELQGATAARPPAGVSAISYPDLMEPRSGWVRLTAAESNPYRKNLRGKVYPFPALTLETRHMSHFGSWPPSIEVDPLLTYYEKYDDGSYGVYPDAARSSLAGSNRTIAQTGYGVLLPDDQNIRNLLDVSVNGLALTTPCITRPLAETIQIDGKNYQLYAFSASVNTALASGVTAAQPATLLLDGTTYRVRTQFAAAIEGKTGPPLGNSQAFPLQVRTPEQLAQAGTFGGQNTFFFQSHNIQMPAGTAWTPIASFGNHSTLDGGGYQIHGLTVPLFQKIEKGSTVQNVSIAGAKLYADKIGSAAIFVVTNEGAIYNCVVSESTLAITNGTVAGFALRNSSTGAIDGCSVLNTTVTSQSAGSFSSGFADSNSGEIGNSGVRSVETATRPPSYARSVVTAANGSAFGFVHENTGTVSLCSAVGTVTGGERASGFVDNNSNKIQKSYANCIVQGSTAAGFATRNTSQIFSCYAMLSVTATNGDASGFLAIGNYLSNMSSSFSVATVSASRGTAYGFAPPVNSYSSCYFRKQSGISPKDAAKGMSYAEMKSDLFAKLNAKTWNNSAPAFPYDEEFKNAANPFPMLNGLAHHGDWPLNWGSVPPHPLTIGVFHYTHSANTSLVEITAGAFRFSSADLDTHAAPIADFVAPPALFRAKIPPAGLPEDGYGVFWSKDFPIDPKDTSTINWHNAGVRLNNGALLSSGYQVNDLQINPRFYFMPVGGLSATTVLSYGKSGYWDCSFTNQGDQFATTVKFYQ